MKTPKQLDHQALVDFTGRWFALWNEADPHARSRQVADLWATDGAQVLVDPPLETRHRECQRGGRIPSPAYTHSRRQAMPCSWHPLSSDWAV
jgi:hypothetical protein